MFQKKIMYSPLHLMLWSLLCSVQIAQSFMQQDKQMLRKIQALNKSKTGSGNVNPRANRVVCVTMPKCGTHLLVKAISLFGEPDLYLPTDGNLEVFKPIGSRKVRMDRLNQLPPPNHYKGIYSERSLPFSLAKSMQFNINKRLYWTHWPYTQDFDFFLHDKTSSNFFIIRDPRDMIISMAHMVRTGWHGEYYKNINDLIFDFIDGRQEHFIRWGVEVHEAYPLLWELGVVGFYKLYLPWMKARRFHTVHFENLIGSKGGGSDDVQAEEILKIAAHLRVELSPEKLAHVQKELFGNSRTFRQGKTGGWQQTFTPEMKRAFKNTPGANQLLIDLGYEKDSNW